MVDYAVNIISFTLRLPRAGCKIFRDLHMYRLSFDERLALVDIKPKLLMGKHQRQMPVAYLLFKEAILHKRLVKFQYPNTVDADNIGYRLRHDVAEKGGRDIERHLLIAG